MAQGVTRPWSKRSNRNYGLTLPMNEPKRWEIAAKAIIKLLHPFDEDDWSGGKTINELMDEMDEKVPGVIREALRHLKRHGKVLGKRSRKEAARRGNGFVYFWFATSPDDL